MERWVACGCCHSLSYSFFKRKTNSYHLMPFLGEVIGVVTVLCWTISIQFFGAASKEVGAIPVNIIRLTLAVLFFSLFLLARDGSPIPMNFPLHAWGYLGLSGVVGFFIGDIFLFKALVELGPRLAMLLHSLAAPTSAVIGWLFLGETYIPLQWLGIFVTLSGVAIVLFDRNPNGEESKDSRQKSAVSVKGILLGIGAMLGQAGGFYSVKWVCR